MTGVHLFSLIAVCMLGGESACQSRTDETLPPSPATPSPPPPPAEPQRPLPTNVVCRDSIAPAIPAPRRTFYINATRGSDGADGRTPHTAWRSLGKANAAAQPGDLFLLSGTFSRQLIHPAESGLPSAKIVYRGMPGTIINGGKYDVIVWLDGVSHIVVEGLELVNEGTAIAMRSGANNNWIRNVYMHDIGSVGVHLITASSNRIEDSRIERVGNEARNTGEGIFIQDGANRNAIVRNTIRNAGHGALWISYQNASEAPSEDNHVERNDFSNPWASGLGMNGKTNRTIVQCNRIHDTADGRGVNYARAGIEVEGDGNIIRFNEIFRSGATGLTIQGRSSAGFTQNATNNRVYQNTFWENGRGGTGAESVQLIQKDVGEVRGNVIEHNIFWHDTGLPADGTRYAVAADLYHATVPWVPGTTNGNVVRTNVFPMGQELLLVIRNGPANDVYSALRAQSVLGGWSDNIQTDPLFVDEAAGDVRLQSQSVASKLGAYCTVGCIVQ
jgi:hypothetical protein